ncbi:MAG: hypothetical protein ABIG60_02445 [Patescibacteria group bacterium]
MIDIISIPLLVKIIDEAKKLDKVATPVKVKNPAKPMMEIIHDILKSGKNYPIRWQLLDKNDLQWLWTLEKSGIVILTEGWLHITRWDKKIGKKPKLIKQKVAGINSALRMQDHILSGYKNKIDHNPSELKKLETIEEIIHEINYLLTNLEGNRYYSQLTLNKLFWVILRLEKCKNEFKVEARKQIEKMVPFKDKLGRINPSAMAARTMAALNRISERVNEIGIIAPQIALRKEMLVFEKRRVEQAIKQAATNVNFITQTNFLNRKSIRPSEKRALLQQIGISMYSLNNIRVSPYWEQTEQAKSYLLSGKKQIFNGKLIKANSLIHTALEILETDMSQYDMPKNK